MTFSRQNARRIGVHRGLPGGFLAGSALILAALQTPMAKAASHVPVATQAKVPGATQADRDGVLGAYAELPLRFEPNAGQAAPAVKFLVRGLGYGVYITPTDMALRLIAADTDARRVSKAAGGALPAATRTSLVRITLVGGRAAAAVTGVDELPGRSNHYVGRDAGRFGTALPQYGRVTVHGVYPGIDLTYYGSQHRLEYDFIVAAGADPDAIRLEVSGAESVALDASGDLVLSTENGRVIEKKPYAYQVIDGKASPVVCRYVVDGNRVAFALGAYDTTLPLVIDPVLAYSTFFGGSGADAGYTVALGPGGDIFVAGYTDSSDLPVESPAQSMVSVGLDGYVARLNPTGSALIYSTYLGGSGRNDTFYALAVDEDGNAYVTGQSDSPDFPVTATPFQGRNAALSAVVAKLDPLGALVYATYLGDGATTFGEDIAVDAAGNVYVAGQTMARDFPVTPGALQQFNGEGGECVVNMTPGGCSDGFITKFVQVTPTLWVAGYSTYFGGTGFDWVHSIALDPAGHLYVTGVTTSDNFPMAAALQPVRAGAKDAFVARLDPDGALELSTYFGGSRNDEGRAIAVDPAGNIFVAGSTLSSDLPLAHPLQPLPGGMEDVFIAKWTAAGPLEYASYLGGGGVDRALAAGLDPSGNFYVAGFTSSMNFPVKHAFQGANNALGRGNAFVSKVNPSGSALVYSSYLGGSESAAIRGMAVDSTGAVVVTGVVMGSTFPLVNPLQALAGGGDETFIARIAEGSSNTGGSSGGLGLANCGSNAAASILQSVLDLIASARLGITDQEDARHVDDVLNDLQAALDPALWDHPQRPTPGHGQHVFKEAGQAVNKLSHLLKKQGSSIAADTVRAWIGMIESATRSAACVAINDAATGGAEPTRIQKARNQLARADLVSRGRHHRAIEFHLQAWRHALKLMP